MIVWCVAFKKKNGDMLAFFVVVVALLLLLGLPVVNIGPKCRLFTALPSPPLPLAKCQLFHPLEKCSPYRPPLKPPKTR